jgi:NAD(P)-dependent dehydrogenase (short-subunit alcohol dehydrogenase family)
MLCPESGTSSRLCVHNAHLQDGADVTHRQVFNFAALAYRKAKDLQDVLLTNVVGTYMVTKAFLPLIRKGHKKQV